MSWKVAKTVPGVHTYIQYTIIPCICHAFQSLPPSDLPKSQGRLNSFHLIWFHAFSLCQACHTLQKTFTVLFPSLPEEREKEEEGGTEAAGNTPTPAYYIGVFFLSRKAPQDTNPRWKILASGSEQKPQALPSLGRRAGFTQGSQQFATSSPSSISRH